MRRPPLIITSACCLLIAAFSALPASARQAGPGPDVRPAPPSERTRPTLAAVRTMSAPVLDGRFDDAAWAAAAPATGFTQLQPSPGAPATQRTEVRIVYDDDAVYVAMRMYDSSPDSIVALLARRDEAVHSDWAYVVFDSYFDRRTGFGFGVNPRGVKRDVMFSDDIHEDASWDAVWDVATAIDSLGWTAEFRIPLSQLRFSAEPEQTWGINFMRRIARRNEESFWSPMRHDVRATVSVFGELHGLSGLRPRRRFELQPYAVSRLTRAPDQPGNPFYRVNDGRLSAGADLKYGLTSDLTLTATVNPDFGQVEADPAVVNLSAFESFFPERRPFFVEGGDIFRFGIGMGDEDDQQLFYSRRIGRAPQGGLPAGARYRDMPEAAPILGAAKISGKTAGWSLGLLGATTGRTEAPWATTDGQLRSSAVEPLTSYAVGRVIRDFREGRSAIGIIGTATNRQLDDDTRFLRSAAYVSGLTARHRFGPGNVYQLSGWLSASHVLGDTLAIRLTQQSPARYFQRADAPVERFDPLRTSLSGWAGSAEFWKAGGGHWRWAGIVNARSPGFEVNDLGFQNSASEVTQVAFVGYHQFRPGRHLRRWNLNVNQWNGWSFDGERIGTGGNVNGSLELNSFHGLAAGVNRNQAALSIGALRGGPALAVPGRTNAWGNVWTDRRQPLSASLNVNVAREDDTGGGSFNVSPTVRWRASQQMELSASPRYARNRAAWQYVGQRNAHGTPVYLFGALDQTTAALTTRLSYTFTPAVSVQFYAQPFISAGAYSRFMEVGDARAAGFAQRFTRYPDAAIVLDGNAGVYRVDRTGDGVADLSFGRPDFNIRQLRTNSVVRWEYRPGSSLYLVWSQGRSQRDALGDFDFGRDGGELVRAPATNVLLLKFSYLMGV
jgi:hypothetical protein